MATLAAVLDAVALTAQGAISQTSPVAPSVVIGGGWPSNTLLQDIVLKQQKVALVAYPSGPQKTARRWGVIEYKRVVIPPGVTSSQPQLGMTPVTVAFQGRVSPNDTVGFIAYFGKKERATSYVAVAQDTPATVAAHLAAAVEADPVLSTWVTTSVFQHSVTVTPIKGIVQVRVPCYNQATSLLEVGRVVIPIGLHLWTPNEVLRRSIGDSITAALAYSTALYGPQLNDGTLSRYVYHGDTYSDVDLQSGLFRRIYLGTAEYGITQTDQLFPVVAPNLSLSVGLDPLSDPPQPPVVIS